VKKKILWTVIALFNLKKMFSTKYAYDSYQIETSQTNKEIRKKCYIYLVWIKLKYNYNYMFFWRCLLN